MNIAEKILASRAGVPEAHAGDILLCKVDYIMTHDATARIIKRFHEIGCEKVWDNGKIVTLIDHWVPADSVQSAVNQVNIRNFAKEQGIKNFFDVKEGICHQIMAEKGFAAPGRLIIGSDSHSLTYGAFGAFSTGMGDTDMAALYVDGITWLRVPEAIKINLTGNLNPYVRGKDIAIYLLGRLGTSYANYACIEFDGDALSQLGIADRMSICNMCVEMGAKAAIFPPNESVFEYLADSGAGEYTPVYPDEDAEYREELTFDVSEIKPQIAAPFSPANAGEVGKFAGTKVDQVYIGSCTNGRIEDLKDAYEILRGKKVADNVRLYISPASRSIYKKAVELGYVAAFLESGAIMLNPTCGPCFGGQLGLIADDEVCVSTSNRNYHGRMGAKNGRIYLANAAVAANCAIAGEIAPIEE